MVTNDAVVEKWFEEPGINDHGADDDPYELVADGNPTGIVELPPEWIRDDAVYFNMQRFSGLRPYTPPTDVLALATVVLESIKELDPDLVRAVERLSIPSSG